MDACLLSWHDSQVFALSMDAVVADIRMPGNVCSLDASETWVAIMCMQADRAIPKCKLYATPWRDLLNGRPLRKMISDYNMESVVFLHATATEVVICVPPKVSVFDVALAKEVDIVAANLPLCRLAACSELGKSLAVFCARDGFNSDACIAFFRKATDGTWLITRTMTCGVNSRHFALDWLGFSADGVYLFGKGSNSHSFIVWLLDALGSEVNYELKEPFACVTSLDAIPDDDLCWLLNWEVEDGGRSMCYGVLAGLCRVRPGTTKVGFETCFVPFPAHAGAPTGDGTRTIVRSRPHLAVVYGEKIQGGPEPYLYSLQALWTRDELHKFLMSDTRLAWIHACVRTLFTR